MFIPLFLPPALLQANPSSAAGFQEVNLSRLEDFRRELTLKFIRELGDPAFRSLLESRLFPEVAHFSLNDLVEDYARLWPTPAHRAFADTMGSLDRDIRRKKGLQAFSHGLLGLDVIWPRNANAQRDWERVLFGVRPQGPKRAVTQVEAYDIHGRLHLLDARASPGDLVIMAGTDHGETKRAGIAFLNAGLRDAGFASAAPPLAVPAPIECGKLTYIHLNDDQEPWWKGAAEVYAFAAGIDPQAVKPSLRLIDLPYLQYDHTDYFPNQLVLFWSEYRFKAACLQLWEQDDGTNYQDILTAVLAAVSAAMAAGGLPVVAWIPALAQAIIQAMPSAWFKDTDDYLDTFYTLEQGHTYEHVPGAANNAVISLTPFTLQPR